MKLTCDMVTDLYPLYKDGLASDDTRAAVKEHLKECDDCRNFYRRYPFQDKLLRRSAAGVLTPPVHSGSATDGFKNVAKKIRRNNRIKVAVIAGAVLIAGAAVAIKFIKFEDKKQ